MSPTTTQLSFAASLILSLYITARTLTPPNTAKKPWAKDNIMISTSDTLGYVLIFAAAFFCHVFIALYPPPPSGAFYCPNAENLNAGLFTWSPWTVTCIASIIAAGSIRILAFYQLGQDFTFRLSQPSRLFTGGIYAYVQHPSYPTLLIVHTCALALAFRFDGVLGCVLPGFVARLTILGVSIDGWMLLGSVLVFLVIFKVRVKDEEEMLKASFGRDWEVWHGKTSRFIPWVW